MIVQRKFFFIVLFLIFILSSCDSNINNQVESYSVEFTLEGGEHTGGGALIQSVKHGSTATAPIVEKDGYVFDGWDQSLNGITSDKIIKANWRNYTASEIYDKVTDATVEIVAYNSSNVPIGLGSGFFYNNQGEIITNYHVIEDAYSIKVRISNSSEYTVTSIKGYSIDLDLAILRINYQNVSYIPLSTRNVSVGESIYAIGSSLGLTDTFSIGNISNNNRVIEGINCYQLTAPISSGNSGGPLVDMFGKAIGVNSMSLIGGDNIYFAIKISEIDKLDVSTPKTVIAVYNEIRLSPFLTTTTVSTNSTVTVNITSTKKYQTLKFTPTVSGTYTIYSTNTTYDSYVKAYNSLYNELDYDDDSGDGLCFRLSINLIGGQTYYFVVSMSPYLPDNYPEFGSFTVFISGSSFINAINITQGSTTYGSISTVGATVVYKFVPTYTGLYVLYSSGSLDLYVTIYDSNGNQLATNDDSGGGLNFALMRNLVSGSTYYYEVKISPYAGAASLKTGSYTMYLTQGTQITTTSYQNAYISYTGGYTLFVFSPTYSGTYIIYSTGTYDSYVELYDGSGNKITSNDDGGTNFNFRLSYYLSSGEVYFFLVQMSPYVLSSYPKTGTFPIYLD